MSVNFHAPAGMYRVIAAVESEHADDDGVPLPPDDLYIVGDFKTVEVAVDKKKEHEKIHNKPDDGGKHVRCDIYNETGMPI